MRSCSRCESWTTWPGLPWSGGIAQAQRDHAQLGVACSFGEWQKDVNGIARAFDPGNGLPMMAINVGGATTTLPQPFLMDEVRPRLIALVNELESTLPR